MKTIVSFAVIAVFLLGLAGCGPTVSADVVKSDKPRITSPAVSQADLGALVDGNNGFALNLYQVLRQSDGNLFYSPYSISEALAMTYAGARGSTETSMAKALSFTPPQDRLHPAFNSLDLQLAQRGKSAKGKEGEGFKLHVVNAIWGQKDYTFLPQFLDVLAQNYGAGLRVVDFIKDTEASRSRINKWVAEQTEDRVKDLVPQGSINQSTRLVLTNAIYFNAAWQSQFKKENTVDGTFNLLNGSSVTVPMMKQVADFQYGEGADYQAVELPYDGNELSMVLLVPKSGRFQPFEQSLDSGVLKGIIGKMEVRRVTLAMPKFQYESSFGLKQPLTALGMGVAFTSDADLSGIDGKRDLLIQDVLHKAFVSVDENGTEAAAATAVIVGRTAMPLPAQLTVDRPFIFVIRDIPTGSIIFVGRVVNPAVK